MSDLSGDRRSPLPPARADAQRALARSMHNSGVESLLVCQPNGQIIRIITERQIAAGALGVPEVGTPSRARPPAEKPDIAAIPAPRSARTRTPEKRS